MMLMLTLLTYAEDYPKKLILSNGDTVVAFTPLQAKNYRLLLVDLEECNINLKDANSIITLQDSSLRSKKELISLFDKQAEYNEELKYQLTASINTQIQRFNILEANYKADAKKWKWQGVKVGVPIGTTVAVIVIVTLLKTFKIF